MKVEKIITDLKCLGSERNLNGMKRFGINTENAFGITIYDIRSYAKKLKKDHDLAMKLWDTKIHEARHLAIIIDLPEKVTEEQIEKWVKDFNSWDLCDQCCNNLFFKTKNIHKKIVEWTNRSEEFVKRAGFVLMCTFAVHDKNAKDSEFEKFYPIIKKHCTDERNYVKKSVNWALRQIGKRNKKLNKKSIEIAIEIEKLNSKSAKWIAKNALRELTSEKIQKKIQKIY